MELVIKLLENELDSFRDFQADGGRFEWKYNNLNKLVDAHFEIARNMLGWLDADINFGKQFGQVEITINFALDFLILPNIVFYHF